MEMKEAETKEEIFSLPYYFTENGKKRYMEIFRNDMLHYNIYDEYGRLIKEYYYGDWWKYFYNDKTGRVTVIDFDAISCRKNKYIRDFNKEDYPNYNAYKKSNI